MQQQQLGHSPAALRNYARRCRDQAALIGAEIARLNAEHSSLIKTAIRHEEVAAISEADPHYRRTAVRGGRA
jgi:hypothetical protein